MEIHQKGENLMWYAWFKQLHKCSFKSDCKKFSVLLNLLLWCWVKDIEVITKQNVDIIMKFYYPTS